MHVGFVMNPVAGMGGRVGLKGTDGKVAEARELGASPRAPGRARRALARLREVGQDVVISTVADPMGASLVREAGFEPTVTFVPSTDTSEQLTADESDANSSQRSAASAEHSESPTTSEPDGSDDVYAEAETTAKDTQEAVRALVDAGVDIVLFVGGDGTAADVAEALEGSGTPMLGVPAGVKVYSSVFAVSPEDAADVVVSFERTERREVMDIDEDEYREGDITPELRAVAHVPVAEPLQSSKQTAGGTVDALAEGFADDVEAGITYVLGPGSTVGAIKDVLGFTPSPIGVDVWRDGEVVIKDASEDEILDALGERNVLVVTPIGGQGFVFGRGNPQLSPAVIRQCELRVVASRDKLDGLSVLRVDTDEPALDEQLRGWIRVRVGKYETRMMKIV